MTPGGPKRDGAHESLEGHPEERQTLIQKVGVFGGGDCDSVVLKGLPGEARVAAGHTQTTH